MSASFPPLLLSALALAACTAADPTPAPPLRIQFLTRQGCANTPVMEERLRAALARLGPGFEVEYVDVGELPADDPRTGFGTPTLLVHGRDLFGAVPPGPATPT
ncbi:MAG: hypothetical protein D6702_10020 [Planctomycetota bacterium]|nr:MAG: hypothetical protein D6702_10020 [Planctomycetota bacterium]